ncbi:RNA polymerase sigma-70 factor, ECF subfamily [Arenibacter palladensis]|uniref:RNA polymerase sigma-70 factor, ECF subfamily n=1 Tax=Arenibacter palladensis TaxID=237373 RepID=A0A1M5C4K4_9FLAO|nr:RNA polymerase sigma-70 factor [Arenibacter palladensis]SHF49678.1 RNA polymerase sigma-70 factor, ECF subfamily [Arenibacter palladensis]
MHNKDTFILESLKNGDERAYKILYDKYYTDLIVYCYNLTKDKDRAEDVVQQTLVKIWIKRDTLQIKSSLKNYLYRSVYNTFLKEYRKIKKEELALSELKNTVLMDFVEKDESFLEERMKLLESAIDQLPKKNREVFLLSKKSGYKHKEIAFQLEISEKAVEKHVSRATQSIKKWLKEKKDNLLLVFLYFRT